MAVNFELNQHHITGLYKHYFRSAIPNFPIEVPTIHTIDMKQLQTMFPRDWKWIQLDYKLFDSLFLIYRGPQNVRILIFYEQSDWIWYYPQYELLHKEGGVYLKMYKQLYHFIGNTWLVFQLT
jgi:hypothetical protein